MRNRYNKLVEDYPLQQKSNLQTMPKDNGEEVMHAKMYYTPKEKQMTDNERVEEYFKALGWLPVTHKNYPDTILYWLSPSKIEFGSLPNILESFPDFKKWVLEVMEGEGYVLTSSGNQWAYWLYLMDAEHPIFDEPIKDNNILHAAVIAATRYLEGKE